MPGGDRRGPAGQGARTGRAAGFCAGYDAPGFMHRGWGRGGGRGGGGLRNRLRAGGAWGLGRAGEIEPDLERSGATGTATLRQRIAELEQSLAALEDRLRSATAAEPGGTSR